MLALLEVLKRIERADDAIFMKAIAPIGAAEIRAVHAIDLGLSSLRSDAIGREDRMLVVHALDDLAWINGIGFIQCDQQRRTIAKTLQDIHVVRQGHTIAFL